MDTPPFPEKNQLSYLMEFRYGRQETFVPVASPEYLSKDQRRFGKQLAFKLFGMQSLDVSVHLERRSFPIAEKWQFLYSEISGRRKVHNIVLFACYKTRYAMIPIKDPRVKVGEIVKSLSNIFGVSMALNNVELAFNGAILKSSASFLAVMGKQYCSNYQSNHIAYPWTMLVNADRYEKIGHVLKSESQIYQKNQLLWADELIPLLEYEAAVEKYEKLVKKEIRDGFVAWHEDQIGKALFQVMMNMKKLQ